MCAVPRGPSDEAASWLPGLHGLLAGIRDNEPRRARIEAERRASSAARPALELGFASIAAFHALEPGHARRLAAAARAAADDDDAAGVAMAAAAGALARAASPGMDEDRDDAGEAADADPEALIARLGDPESLLARFLRYQFAEARLACGRVAEAVALVDRGAGLVPLPDPGRAEPAELLESALALRESTLALRAFGTVMRSRALLFQGRVAEAEVESGAQHEELLRGGIVPEGFRTVVLATRLLIAANADERPLVRRLVHELSGTAEPAPTYRSAGALLLIAYGLLAAGDVAGAARHVHLSRSCGPLTRVDEAFSLEILVSLAAADRDQGAADAWLQLADALDGSRIAQPAIHRTRSRVRLLAGETEAAVAEAERAAELAEREGRRIEAAEAEILAARARIAAQRPGEAALGLERLLEISDATGYRRARRAAARELRATGRRLRPSPGSELSGLSERERDVAMLIAAGLSNREVATTLFLSPHTVRVHVSRVLAAFGAASRLAVAARVGELLPPPDEAPPPLTPRQYAVAEGVSRGLGNAAIATELGISVKTVEKHLTEIHRRWGVHTRTGVSRLLRAAPPPAGSIGG